MDSGLAALLGAVVGGALTGGSNLLIEQVRARRSARNDHQRDARELRRAARLVMAELRHSGAALEVAASEGWEHDDRRELKYQRWVAHQQTLADHLPDPSWEAVTGAYEIAYLVYRATEAPESQPESDLLEKAIAELRGAYGILDLETKRAANRGQLVGN